MTPRPKRKPPLDTQEPFPSDKANSVDEILQWIDANANTIGGVWLVEVYWVFAAPQRGLSEPFIFDCKLEELPTLRQTLMQYGTGKYRIRVKCDGVTRKQFDMEVWKREEPVHAAPATTGLETAIGALIAQQRDFQNVVLEAIKAKPAERAASTSDLAEQVKTVASIMKEMREANPPPPPNVGIEMFEKGMTFAEKLTRANGGEGGVVSPGWVEIARDLTHELLNSDAGRELAQGIASFLSRQPAARQQPMAGRPMPQQIQRPASPAPIAPPVQPSAPQAAAQPITNQMQMGIAYIVEQAKAGADPALTAEYVYGVLPDESLANLAAQGSAENIVAYIEAAFPEIQQHHAWLVAFVAKLIELDQPTAEELAAENVERARSTDNVPAHDTGRPAGHA